MAEFTTKELFDAVISRLEAAVFQGTADAIFNLVKATSNFDIQEGFRYASNVPAAMVLFDGQTPLPNNPEIVDTEVAVIALIDGAPDVGNDQWAEGTLIGSKGLLDVVTGVRAAMAYHDGDDDAYQIVWRQTTAGFILARRDSPARLIGVELKFTCRHQDLTT